MRIVNISQERKGDGTSVARSRSGHMHGHRGVLWNHEAATHTQAKRHLVCDRHRRSGGNTPVHQLVHRMNGD